MMVNKNSSRLRLRTMCSSKIGTAYHAPTRMQATTTNDFPKESNTGASAPSPGLARMGVSKIIGTTAMSWNTKIPIVARPCGESLASLAVNALSTMAVLLSESRKPQKIA